MKIVKISFLDGEGRELASECLTMEQLRFPSLAAATANDIVKHLVFAAYCRAYSKALPAILEAGAIRAGAIHDDK